MRTINRNMAVIAVLLIVLLVQVIAVGKPEPIKDNSTTDVMADAGIEETLPQDDMDIVVEEEIVSAELNVVYRSPLASSDVVDEFAEDETSSIYEDKIVSYTVNRLCVYELPDLTSKVVGVMYAGTEADIVEIGSEWTKISSGSVTGYVRNVAVIFGGEAEIIAEFIGSECSEVTANSLTVYEDASSDSTAIDTLSKGDRVTAVEVCGDYVLVTTDSTLGYVLKSGVNISFGLGKAITIDEENEINAQKAAEEAKKKAEEAAQAAKDKLTNVTTTNRGAISATPEEIHLLAAIIYWESGWEPMEGQIAVGNIVLNRVFQSRFKQNTIADVIYAPGQFSGVLTNGVISDRFQAVLNLTDEQLNARGCYDAALVALSGVNNIGDLNFFVSVKKANYAKYTSYTIINNHCFYTY